MATAYVPDDYFMRARELTRYSVAASVAILYYDYVLTLNSEIKLFWVDFHLSWPSFFYFFNRYLTLIAHIPVLVEFFWGLPEEAHQFDSCHRLQLFHQIYCAVSVALVATMSAMRAYALYERNRVLHVFLVTFVLGGFCIGCWQILSAPSTVISSDGDTKACGILSTPEQAKHYALAWLVPMMFDCTIFALILYKRLQIGRTLHNSMFTLMLRDGTIYFSFLALFYLLELVNFLVWDDIIQMATLTTVMASTLISRLMLNIRNPKNHGILLPPSMALSTLVFSQPDIILTESTFSDNPDD